MSVDRDDAVRGYRYWYLDGDPPYLTSANTLDRWPHDGPHRAVCRLWGHRAPDRACRCGLYGARRLESLESYGFPALTYLVVGEIEMWGLVVSDELTHRAEFARPVRLWLVTETVPAGEDPGRLCRRIARCYSVPVDLRAGGDALATSGRF